MVEKILNIIVPFCYKTTNFILVRLLYVFSKFYSIWKLQTISNKPKCFHVGYGTKIIGGEFITIGDFFIGNNGFIVEALKQYNNEKFTPLIKIGNNVFFNKNCRIACINKVIIGNNVMSGGNVLITDHYHGDPNLFDYFSPKERSIFTKGPVVINDDVLIGEGTVILSNLVIGKGAIIGANSVVTKDIPAYTVFAGNPAKKIRELQIN